MVSKYSLACSCTDWKSTMTARAGYHVRMLTYSETKTVHGSVLDWTLLRMRVFSCLTEIQDGRYCCYC